MIDGDAGETGRDAGTQAALRFTQHVTQPMATFFEHLRQEPLDLSPAIVDAIEQQLDIGHQRGIGIAAHEHAACGPSIQLTGPLSDNESPARLSGDGQLTREPGVNESIVCTRSRPRLSLSPQLRARSRLRTAPARATSRAA